MSLHAAIARLLDRPGGRTLLASFTTFYARRLARADIAVSFDQVWLHRCGCDYFPDGVRFRYQRDQFLRWPSQRARCTAATRAYWYYGGEPDAGETVVDVGAGRGEDLPAFCASVGARGSVVAIEAHPQTFELLRLFIALNGLRNVQCVHAAAMDFDGSALISDCDDWQSNAIGADGIYSVPAHTLDHICSSAVPGSVGLLKMNIEGSEVAALGGAEQLLQRTRRVAIACHDFRADRGDGERFRTRSDVLAILKASGFEVSDRREDARPGIQDHVFGVRR